MSAIITEKSRIFAAQNLLANVNNANLFLFEGHTYPWTSADAPGATEIAPPYPIDTVNGSIAVWKTMMNLIKINSSNCSLVIPNHQWTLNTVYTQYDPDIDLFDASLGLKPFYVITQDFNVYKCIFNYNNGPSYVQPTGTSTNIIQTGDGYNWKYMFTVSPAGQENFLTNQWIPVYTLKADDNSNQWNVQQASIPGQINLIQVISGGFGFTNNPAVTITGDGTGATATSVIKNGSVFQINMTSYGEGYSEAQATVPGGQITLIIVTVPGSGYVSVPAVSITGDGSGATAHAVLSAGTVQSIVIDDPGENYTMVTVNIAAGSGVQATANAVVSGGATLKVIISPPGGHGSDPVNELGAMFAMTSGNFQFDNNGLFTVSNDFRTVGVVANPLLWGSTEAATGTAYTQAWTIPLTNVSGTFNNDDIVVGSISGAKGTLLDYGVPGANIARIVDVIGQFIPGENVNDITSSATGLIQFYSGTAQSGGTLEITLSNSDPGTNSEYLGATIRITGGSGSGQVRIISSYDSSTKVAIVTKNWTTTPDSTSAYKIGLITYPGLQPNTGQIIYVENRRAITRASKQIETISPVFQY